MSPPSLIGSSDRIFGDQRSPETGGGAPNCGQRPQSLDEITEVLFLTARADLQDGRIELSTVGWTRDGGARVLAHEVGWGSPMEDATWQELDELLTRQWVHAMIRLDAAVIDSGNWADQVYGFTRPRISRRIIAGKGVAGFGRPSLAWGAS